KTTCATTGIFRESRCRFTSDRSRFPDGIAARTAANLEKSRADNLPKPLLERRGFHYGTPDADLLQAEVGSRTELQPKRQPTSKNPVLTTTPNPSLKGRGFHYGTSGADLLPAEVGFRTELQPERLKIPKNPVLTTSPSPSFQGGAFIMGLPAQIYFRQK
uniref:hypothetical protein n=1 Tax=uncultured Alistipes sp. TaxID=538949 RepID=UPI0025982BE2